MSRHMFAIGTIGPSHPEGITQVLARCCCRCGPLTPMDAALLEEGAMRTDGFCPACEAAFYAEMDAHEEAPGPEANPDPRARATRSRSALHAPEDRRHRP